MVQSHKRYVRFIQKTEPIATYPKNIYLTSQKLELIKEENFEMFLVSSDRKKTLLLPKTKIGFQGREVNIKKKEKPSERQTCYPKTKKNKTKCNWTG